MPDEPNSAYDNRYNLRLGAMTFSIVVGSALLAQGAQIIVKNATAESASSAPVEAKLDFEKFKRTAAVSVPKDEVIINLASESLRGAMD
jgi:hypothetical protein